MIIRLSRRHRSGWRSALPKLIAITGSVALLSTIVVSSTPNAAQAKPAPLKDLVSTDAYPTPKIAWKNCRSGWRTTIQCGTVRVPLNWQQPRGKTIELALVKVPAANPKKRLGSVFFNPGGPGGPAIDAVQNFTGLFSPQVSERFDIIGFDPRFVGKSSPALCITGKQYEEWFSTLPDFPMGAAQEANHLRTIAAYTKACASKAPQLRYASTGSVARDMDVLRKAVGDKQLTYVGYSYGSYLGQVYAQLFPTKVRALVLDGVLDAKAWATGNGREATRLPFTARLFSDKATSRALNEFLRRCGEVGPTRCAAAESGDPRKVYEYIATSLKTKPLPLGEDAELTYSGFISTTMTQLQTGGYLVYLGADLAELYDLIKQTRAANNPHAAVARATARSQKAKNTVARVKKILKDQQVRPTYQLPGYDPVVDPSEDDTAAVRNVDETFMAVTCEDTANPRNPAVWPAVGAARDKAYPYFGRPWTWRSASCATWPLADPNAFRGPFGGESVPPMLVVSTTLDNVTPMEGAVATATRYPTSRLLLVKGFGHTSNSVPSVCAVRAHTAYLVEGKLPAAGTVCEQDVDPFYPR